ncbi:hypothetical protein [Streptomyces antibioticus]|uniref:hypothetical protein n=1 Tax=Streptomyces antibioticus TaxID=1890 RepID=UPI003D70AEB3
MLSLTGRAAPGAVPHRPGRATLLERFRHPEPAEISAHVRFDTVLAFLRHLPAPAERAAVPRRRPEYLETPASFFCDDGEPVRAEDTGDPFRQGVPRVARATGEAERTWLREPLDTPAQRS